NYLNVLRTSQLLQVAESDLAVSRERRRVAGLRYIAGAGARLEVLQANTQLAEAQQRRIRARNALAQSKAALHLLMGRAPETPVRVADVTALTPRVPLPAGVGDPLQTEPAAPAPGVPAAPAPGVPAAVGSEALREIADQTNPTLAANRAQVEAAL